MTAPDDLWSGLGRIGVDRWLAPCVGAWVASWRVEIHGRELLDDGPRIFALWHGQMAALLGGIGAAGRVAILQAPFAQARFVAGVVGPIGIAFVEAGTGSQALVRAARRVREGWSLAVAVDGPAGPAFHARSGASVLSRMTGVSVVPVTAEARPSWSPTGFWDRAEVPLPFARVVIRAGGPLPPPRSRGDIKAHVARVQHALAAGACVPGAHT